MVAKEDMISIHEPHWTDKFVIRNDGISKYQSSLTGFPSLQGKGRRDREFLGVRLTETSFHDIPTVVKIGEELNNWHFDFRFQSTYYGMGSRYKEDLEDLAYCNRSGLLPPEIEELMGKQIINGRLVYVTSVSFREDDNGHACQNPIVYVSAKDMSHGHLDRLSLDFYDRNLEDLERTILNPYILRWLKLFGKIIKPLEYQGFKKPQSKLTYPVFPELDPHKAMTWKNIDGMNYPWLWCDPWIGSDFCFRENGNGLSSIRFVDLYREKHVTIILPEEYYPEASYVIAKFSYEKPFQVRISSWANHEYISAEYIGFHQNESRYNFDTRKNEEIAYHWVRWKNRHNDDYTKLSVSSRELYQIINQRDVVRDISTYKTYDTSSETIVNLSV